MKRLMFLLLLTGSVGMALADDVTCFLPADKRTVTALPDEQLTLGVPDPNSGRTVCYRWSSSDCSSCFSGPTDQPTVNVTMPHEPGTYHFTVKRIGNHVETCTVNVVVEETVEIVSVTPINECWNSGDEIDESQFEIVTDPPDYSSRVKLSSDSKIARCSFGGTHVTGGCEQNLLFQIEKNGNIVDDYNCEITVYSESGSSTSQSGSIEFPKALTKAVKKINEADVFLNALTGQANNIKDKLVEKVPKIKDYIEVNDFNVGVTASLEYKRGICCKGKANQGVYGVTVGGSVSGGLELKVPVKIIVIAIFPGTATFLKSPRWDFLKVTGGVDMTLGLAAEVSYNECSELTLDIPVSLTIAGTGGGRVDLFGDKIEASAKLFIEGSSKRILFHVIPLGWPEAYIGVSIGADVSARFGPDWFKLEPLHRRWTWINANFKI